MFNSDLKSWVSPFEPMFTSLAGVLMLPAFMGVTSPPSGLLVHLLASSVACIVSTTLLGCWTYHLLFNKPEGDPHIEKSRAASFSRKTLGYHIFLWRLWIFCCGLGVAGGLGASLVSLLFDKSISILQMIIIVPVVAALATIGGFIQALALDRRYRSKV